MMKRAILFFLLAGWTASACAPSLKPEDDGSGAGAGLPQGAKVSTTDNGDGTFTTIVDATSETDYVYFDFESQSEKTVEKPLNSEDWDVGFKRHLIASNGGVSGPGGVMAAVVEATTMPFGDLEDAPTTGYRTDQEDPPEDGDEDPDHVFNALETQWFNYNATNHTLTPKDWTYVVRTVEGRHFKVQILDYYDSAGTPGYMKIRWAEVGPPSTADSFTVDANDGLVYLSIASGGIVSVSDPGTSMDWDLALDKNTLIRTNGGESGPGFGGARVGEDTVPYEDVADTPTIGFTADTLITPPGPPGQPETPGHAEMNLWYDYDPMSHKVTTRGDVFVVRGANGDYGKFQIIYFADGVYELRLAPVTRVVTDESSSIDASAGWTYYSFRLGATVEPDDPAASLDWDLALNDVMLQTNGGTSGSEGGGAIDPTAAELDDIATAPTSGYSIDEDLSIDGNDFSGSPILNPWYQTGTTTAQDKAFVLRTADGGYVRLKIESYSSGTYMIDWTYAGAGLTDF